MNPETAVSHIQFDEQTERLRSMHAAYTAAKSAADAASEQLKAITDAIKAELSAAAPNTDRVVLPAHGDAPALRLARTETWRLDTAKLKREQLETYVRYARKSESWVLRVMASGGEDE